MKAATVPSKVPFTQQQARDARDALAKEIYVRTFDYIVSKINTATSSVMSTGRWSSVCWPS